MATSVKSLIEEPNQLPEPRGCGRVAGVPGPRVEMACLERHLPVGARRNLAVRYGRGVASAERQEELRAA